MSYDADDLVGELRHEVARLHGELDAVRAEVAALEAAQEQLRIELEAARVEAHGAQVALGLHQQHAEERAESARRRIVELERDRDEARRLAAEAMAERSALIAALGRRARRRLEHGGEQPAPSPA